MFIIFTIGRTGSTLLTYILNQYRGVTAAGEIFSYDLLRNIFNGGKPNKEVFNHIFNNKMSYQVRGSSRTCPTYMPKNCNYYKYFDNTDKFMEEINKLESVEDRLKFLMPQDNIVGFKVLASTKRVEDFLKWKNIKNVKIILLVREDLIKLRKSMVNAGFVNKHLPRKHESLRMENDGYKKIYDENKSNTYYLSYEDIINKRERFKKMFDFLGIKYNDKNTDRGLNTLCSYATTFVVKKVHIDD